MVSENIPLHQGLFGSRRASDDDQALDYMQNVAELGGEVVAIVPEDDAFRLFIKAPPFRAGESSSDRTWWNRLDDATWGESEVLE